ncbi:hypothetical protein RLJV_23415 [Pseudomonas aeruginosa]|nr:hypothetical protein RLJV_23415 [Pseudomonas aeruginosa]
MSATKNSISSRSRALVQLGDLVDQVGRPLHQAQRVLQHHLAFRRRAQVLAATVHQLTAKLRNIGQRHLPFGMCWF